MNTDKGNADKDTHVADAKNLLGTQSECCHADSAGSEEHGYGENKKKYIARLKRIEGQVRGIQRMVDGDEYCIDILTQISAINSALKGVSLALLDDHLGHCVRHALEDGGNQAEEKLAEASAAIARMVK